MCKQCEGSYGISDTVFITEAGDVKDVQVYMGLRNDDEGDYPLINVERADSLIVTIPINYCPICGVKL